jgi:hypothetical protein
VVPGAPGDVPTAAEPGAPGMVWKARDLGVGVPDAWRTCTASSDCALVVTTCCDQCNGGKAVAVNAARAPSVRAASPQSCGGAVCTERGCMTRASCESGRCVLEWLTGPE